jgi:hypothetical protein
LFEEASLSHPNTDTAGHGEEPIFRFSYRSIPFDVRLHPGSDKCLSTLEGTLGVVPFTVDGTERRKGMRTVVAKLCRMPGFRIDIGTDHTINLSVALPAQGAPSPADILAAAIKTLATAKDCLDLILSLQPSHMRPAAERRFRTAP